MDSVGHMLWMVLVTCYGWCWTRAMDGVGHMSWMVLVTLSHLSEKQISILRIN